MTVAYEEFVAILAEQPCCMLYQRRRLLGTEGEHSETCAEAAGYRRPDHVPTGIGMCPIVWHLRGGDYALQCILPEDHEPAAEPGGHVWAESSDMPGYYWQPPTPSYPQRSLFSF